MALIPLVDLAHAAALLGIRPWHPADAPDLEVLRALLARRVALADRARPVSRRTGPRLRVVE